MFDDFFKSLNEIPNFENYLFAGLLIFPRFLGFMLMAPAFSRKDVPSLAKLGFALMMTLWFLGSFKDVPPPAEVSYMLAIVLNFVFGLVIGFVANVIFQTVVVAGEMVNMQMGLQSAVMFDQNARGQTSVMGKFFMHFGTIIFINIGGLFWIFLAFQRGFDVFPIYGTSIPMAEVISMKYLVFLTGNMLFIGLQMASPVVITTLCQDIILGVISKTAPQVNVFQLSFLFKPLLGSTIMIIILPLLINTIIDYFYRYAKIY